MLDPVVEIRDPISPDAASVKVWMVVEWTDGISLPT